MLTIVQTVAIIVASLASAYAIADSEIDRRRAARQARVERLMDATLALAEAAALTLPRLDVPRRRLRAELQVTGIEGFKGVELMTRDKVEPRDIVNQSEAGITEIAAALAELAPRPLLGLAVDHLRKGLPRRRSQPLRPRHGH